jgi:phospholipid transport system substrate-binding protein
MPISEPSRRIGRRTFLAAAGAAALIASPRGARASAQSRAVAMVQELGAQVVGLVNAGRSEAQLYGAFEQLLARYGDMPVVAASVLGPPWRSASQRQKQQFVAAFQGYVARRYGRQFREWQNMRIEVVRARDAGRAGVLVETAVLRPGREPVRVEWQVSERSGRPKVVNLIIEGVSMLANERAEVGAMLEAQGGDLDRLIAQMRRQA